MAKPTPKQRQAEEKLRRLRRMNGETYLKLQQLGEMPSDYEVLMIRLEALIEHLAPGDSVDRINLEIYFEKSTSAYLQARLKQIAERTVWEPPTDPESDPVIRRNTG